jgi:hypothetical protein
MFSQVSHIQQQCFEIGPDTCDSAEWRHQHPYDKNEVRFRQATGYLKEVPRPHVEVPVATGGGSEDKRLQEWAIHQVEHCLDYAVDSKFWLHISNGLNLQVVHHLFPQVGWGHYRELSRIIQEVCNSFGVKYSVKPTFWSAAVSHIEYVTRINDEPLASVWVRPSVRYAPDHVMDCLDQLDWIPAEKCKPPLARAKGE